MSVIFNHLLSDRHYTMKKLIAIIALAAASAGCEENVWSDQHHVESDVSIESEVRTLLLYGC